MHYLLGLLLMTVGVAGYMVCMRNAKRLIRIMRSKLGDRSPATRRTFGLLADYRMAFGRDELYWTIVRSIICGMLCLAVLALPGWLILVPLVRDLGGFGQGS